MLPDNGAVLMALRSQLVRIRVPAYERGQAMILTVVLIAVGVGAALLVMTSTVSVSIANKQAKHNEAVLARVKEALIGWSAARTRTATNPNARPGELPCPDTDNNGFAENDDDNDGVDEASCASGTIGRVPWKTLGIPEPKDSAGETLWYAVSGNFRVYRDTAPHAYTSPITSDTLGTLTIYHETTSNTITNEAIAVIFAPGVALGTQDRSTTTTMSCAAPSGTYFRHQCASNYLEIAGGVNNARINGPYIRAQASATFNDRLLVITNADLMPVVEQRVGREMRSLLDAYRAATLFYPWADSNDGNSDLGYNRGRFPCNPAGTLPVVWGSVTPATPTLPAWLTNGCGNNGWASVIYYAAGQGSLDVGCTTCETVPPCLDLSLNLDVACGTSLVLLTPGAASGARTWVTGYFEDAENSDNNDDRYVTPTSRNYDRDRIFTTP